MCGPRNRARFATALRRRPPFLGRSVVVRERVLGLVSKRREGYLPTRTSRRGSSERIIDLASAQDFGRVCELRRLLDDVATAPVDAQNTLSRRPQLLKNLSRNR